MEMGIRNSPELYRKFHEVVEKHFRHFSAYSKCFSEKIGQLTDR